MSSVLVFVLLIFVPLFLVSAIGALIDQVQVMREFKRLCVEYPNFVVGWLSSHAAWTVVRNELSAEERFRRRLVGPFKIVGPDNIVIVAYCRSMDRRDTVRQLLDGFERTALVKP